MTEEQHSPCEANDEFSKQSHNLRLERISQWPRVLTFFTRSRSLSQEMFVHNSGARNVIHLFVLWCGVLRNIDERQSVGEVCVLVSMSKVGGSRGGCG